MNHTSLIVDNQSEISRLFKSVFTDSEGKEAGELIGNLVQQLSNQIDNESLICLGTMLNDDIIASIFFSPLVHDDVPSGISIFMLSPVAVASEHQGRGVGQSLIRFGIEDLKSRGIDVVVTYGDPAYYAKVGFQPLSEDVIQAPLKMSMPHGWLGMSLTEQPIPTIQSKPRCIEAFNNPAYW